MSTRARRPDSVHEGILGRPVIDKTQMNGLYDFILEWTPEPGQGPVAPGVSDPPPNQSADISGPSIFTAIQEQLGLKLESTKGPVAVLIVERVQKPAGN
jgi:bla regulator protein blaR1